MMGIRKRAQIIENKLPKKLVGQREVMDRLYMKNGLNSLSDWLEISPSKFSNSGGLELLQNHNNDFSSLLLSTYPHYPWKFKLNVKSLKEKYKEEYKEKQKEVRNKRKRRKREEESKERTKEVQQKKMDQIYIQLNLKSLEDWIQVSKSTFKSYGGNKLLEEHSDSFYSLLSTLYPHYPWDESKFVNKKVKLSLKSKENQHLKMESLYYSLQMKSFDDWLEISTSEIFSKGCGWLFQKYRNNLRNLLTSLYPHYPWDFANQFNHRKKFKSIQIQRQFMDQLYHQLNFKSIDQWVDFPRKKLIELGARTLLDHFDQNLPLLFTTLYPNFPWNFEQKINEKKSKNLNSLSPSLLSSYRERMIELFYKLNLKSLDDWITIPQSILVRTIGVKLFGNHLSLFKSLSLLFPNYPFHQLKNLFIFQQSRDPFQSIYYSFPQFLDQLFSQFQLSNLIDWLNVSLSKISLHGGKNLVQYYHYNRFELFRGIYPNFPWNFTSKIFEFKQNKFRYIDQQREYMDELFHYLHLNSLDEWLKVYKFHQLKNIKKKYKIEKKMIKIALITLYPNFPWDFATPFNIKNVSRKQLRSIEFQRDFMERLYLKLQLKTLNDWRDISIRKMSEYGLKRILNLYHNNKFNFLSTLYPYYPWSDQLLYYYYPWKSIKNHPRSFSSLSPPLQSFLTEKIRFYIHRYAITQKKDWYRVADIQRNFRVFQMLKLFFPNEKWRLSTFILRTKKSTQRLLFAFTQQIYPSLLIFEGYFHPLFTLSHNQELDLFIPALHLALEYQGEQHYDDLPSCGFANIESCIFRDEVKEQSAADLNIKIVYIPYWWDHSLSSLKSSLLSI